MRKPPKHPIAFTLNSENRPGFIQLHIASPTQNDDLIFRAIQARQLSKSVYFTVAIKASITYTYQDRRTRRVWFVARHV